jgi:dTDP-4-dehydrorhamnose reductase
MKILVTGANGQLGNELRIISPLYIQNTFTFVDKNELELTNIFEVENYIRTLKPEIIIHCAAYTAVDKAETEQEMAILINATAVGVMARVSAELGIILISVSTDYIFNGLSHIPYVETDLADPVSFYGKSKYEGEQEILRYNPAGVILRTSWLYSEFGVNFVKTIRSKATEKKELRVVYDQIGSPTYAADLAEVILTFLPEFCKKTSMEIYHYSNEGTATWFDFACAILDISGITCEIAPILTEEINQPAKRPSYSLLDKSKIRTEFNLSIPYWRKSLEKCLLKLNKTS